MLFFYKKMVYDRRKRDDAGRRKSTKEPKRVIKNISSSITNPIATAINKARTKSYANNGKTSTNKIKTRPYLHKDTKPSPDGKAKYKDTEPSATIYSLTLPDPENKKGRARQEKIRKKHVNDAANKGGNTLRSDEASRYNRDKKTQGTDADGNSSARVSTASQKKLVPRTPIEMYTKKERRADRKVARTDAKVQDAAAKDMRKWREEESKDKRKEREYESKERGKAVKERKKAKRRSDRASKNPVDKADNRESNKRKRKRARASRQRSRGTNSML
jgi:hypothetical protein